VWDCEIDPDIAIYNIENLRVVAVE
jgi:hypothetical protein